jgi:hypothetical protein
VPVAAAHDLTVSPRATTRVGARQKPERGSLWALTSTQATGIGQTAEVPSPDYPTPAVVLVVDADGGSLRARSAGPAAGATFEVGPTLDRAGAS